MKMIFEVGDRVELVDGRGIEQHFGSTGTVRRVIAHDHDDSYTVEFEMDNPPKNRKQGYGIICGPEHLKYLGEEVPEDIATELRGLLTRMGKSIDIHPGSSYEGILRWNSVKALNALWAVANLDDYVNADTRPEVNRVVVELKKTLIAKLKETA